MATICRQCASNKKIESLPPVRTVRDPCDFCGGYDMMFNARTREQKKIDRNYDYPDIQLPGHKLDPNAIAEREEQGA